MGVIFVVAAADAPAVCVSVVVIVVTAFVAAVAIVDDDYVCCLPMPTTNSVICRSGFFGSRFSETSFTVRTRFI